MTYNGLVWRPALLSVCPVISYPKQPSNIQTTLTLSRGRYFLDHGSVTTYTRSSARQCQCCSQVKIICINLDRISCSVYLLISMGYPTTVPQTKMNSICNPNQIAKLLIEVSVVRSPNNIASTLLDLMVNRPWRKWSTNINKTITQ